MIKWRRPIVLFTCKENDIFLIKLCLLNSKNKFKIYEIVLAGAMLLVEELVEILIFLRKE